MFINRTVMGLLSDANIRVFFVSGRVTKWYNAQRADKLNEVCLLGGWYWIHREQEQGPFRTISGARRDAYYRIILKQRPPILDNEQVEAAEMLITRQVEAAKAKAARTAKRARARQAVL